MDDLGAIFTFEKKIVKIRPTNVCWPLLFIFMKQYPKLKFLISQSQELKTFSNFLKESQMQNNDRERDWAFFRPHPSLKILKRTILSSRQRKVIIQNYISSFYGKNVNEIRKDTVFIKYGWGKLEKSFYQSVDKIFRHYPWPKGKYIVYPTIWGMYSRNIREKTFQFPYKHYQKNYPFVVIAHEMLHFIFYNYFFKHYPRYRKGKYDLFVWHISEIFNVIIQNSPPWLKIFNTHVQTYPEHRKIIEQLQQRYYFNNKDIEAERLIQDIIEKVKKRKL